MLGQLISSFKMASPIKAATVKPGGIHLEGVLLPKADFPNSGGKTSTATSAVVNELHGATGPSKSSGGGGGGKPAYVKHEFTLLPTNVPDLISKWIKASPDEKELLPYVPVWNATVPTIAIRFTGLYKEDSKADNSPAYFFQIPIDRDEYHIEYMKPRSISTFTAVSLKSLPAFANVVSFTYAPKLGKEMSESEMESELEIYPNTLVVPLPGPDRYSVVSLYSSCTNITQSTGPLDSIPREYRLNAYLFDPSFIYNFSLPELVNRKTKLSRRSYQPILTPLYLTKDYTSTQFSSSSSSTPDIPAGLPGSEGIQLQYDQVRLAPFYKGELEVRRIDLNSEIAKINKLLAGDTLEGKIDLSDQIMMYKTQFNQRKPTGQNGFYTGNEYQAYQLPTQQDNSLRNFARAQIAFSTVLTTILEEEMTIPTPPPHSTHSEIQTQPSDKSLESDEQQTTSTDVALSSQPSTSSSSNAIEYADTFRNEKTLMASTTNGQILNSLWENHVDECGINNEFANLMASHGIACSVLFRVYVEKTMKMQENNEESMRTETPAGIIEGGPAVVYWHVIEYVRKFGIPVTADWVKKVLSGQVEDDGTALTKFMCPSNLELRPNIVNLKNGDDYGFFNLSENRSINKDKFYVPENQWKFAVLFDYNYNALPKDWKAELKSLTPQDGTNIMTGQPIANGKTITLQPRNSTSCVIIAYKYNPEWSNQVTQFKKNRIMLLSTWRSLRSYFKCLEPHAHMYYVFSDSSMPHLLRYHMNEELPRQTFPESPILEYNPTDYVEKTSWGDLVYDFFDSCRDKATIFSDSVHLLERKFFKEFITRNEKRFHPDFVEKVKALPSKEEPSQANGSMTLTPGVVTSSSSSSSSISSTNSSGTQPKLIQAPIKPAKLKSSSGALNQSNSSSQNNQNQNKPMTTAGIKRKADEISDHDKEENDEEEETEKKDTSVKEKEKEKGKGVPQKSTGKAQTTNTKPPQKKAKTN
jgi:hypothetical protein